MCVYRWVVGRPRGDGGNALSDVCLAMPNPQKTLLEGKCGSAYGCTHICKYRRNFAGILCSSQRASPRLAVGEGFPHLGELPLPLLVRFAANFPHGHMRTVRIVLDFDERVSYHKLGLRGLIILGRIDLRLLQDRRRPPRERQHRWCIFWKWRSNKVSRPFVVELLPSFMECCQRNAPRVHEVILGRIEVILVVR